jgi:hypothetical protein
MLYPDKLPEDILKESAGESTFWFLIAQVLKESTSSEAYRVAVTRALDWAIMYGSDDTVDLLLSLGPDINFKSNGAELTPFQRAFKKKRNYVVKRLIDEGCDCSGPIDWRGRTALDVSEQVLKWVRERDERMAQSM